MSDLPPQTTNGLVGELKQLLAVEGVGSFGSSTLLFRFADVADVARQYEARWQADMLVLENLRAAIRQLEKSLLDHANVCRERSQHTEANVLTNMSIDVAALLLIRALPVVGVAEEDKDRARWQERERRLRELMSQLRGGRQMAREEIAGAIGAILAPEQDAPTE